MIQTRAKVIKNKRVAQKYFNLVLSCLPIAKQAKPGQFVNIKVANGYEPLLRRHLSIHRVNGPTIEVLYELVGKGTELLSQKEQGEYLDIIGPLGNGFDWRGTKSECHQSPVLVAGGIGVAPLLFLAEKMRASSPSHQVASKVLVLLGARTKENILCVKEFKKLGCDVKIATDDGSAGYKGKVAELLLSVLRTPDSQPRTIYACGPKPMLKAIAEISRKYRIPAQISMEEHMACGIGACLGCVVKTKQGYKRVCKEGPVFNAEEIIWAV